jgi:pimeloyl-ACP methyl ester carboxylesterase
MSTRTLRAEGAGVGIAYEVVGAGAPVLLIQGLGYGGRGWGSVVDRLAEAFLVVLYDNRGFGASDVPPGPYSVSQLVEDALAVLDAAGLERTHVVGASLGGMVAQELALTHPDRVDRLVLACTTPGGPGSHPMPGRTIELMAQAAALDPDVALRRFVENALGGTDPELVERVLAYRRTNPPDPVGWSALAAAGATFDAVDRVAAIEAPTLVVTGTADAVVDPRNSELLAARIPGSRLELLDGCGHLLFWEQPDSFVELLRGFLR